MFGKKAVVPKKLEHWFLDEPAVLRLRELLQDPVLQLAVATLQASVQPTSRAVSHDRDQNERALCILAGYHDFFRDLEKLTQFPRSRAADAEEWSHIQLEQDLA
jgi:hypothetical protein